MWHKRPNNAWSHAKVSRETYKRDLIMWQKRPNNIGILFTAH